MTHRIHSTRRALSVAAAILTITQVASAQSLESRVAASRGTVTFEYVTRPNVCGDGSSINVSSDSSSGWNRRPNRSGVHVGTRRGVGYERCDTGPARVTLRLDGGKATDLHVAVGGPQTQADTDLGEVPSAEAARYLLAIAPRLAGRSGDEAVMGAEIAADVVVWPTLLQIARDDGASESSRKSALFWISREASDAATAGLDSLAVDDATTISVRSDALYYLAQRPRGEGIPALVRVAETSKSVKLRKDAIWFLAQSRDSRALALFEKLLVGR
jgi:hypothetical protein